MVVATRARQHRALDCAGADRREIALEAQQKLFAFAPLSGPLSRTGSSHVCTIGVGLALAALTLWPASASAQLFGGGAGTVYGGAGTVYNVNWDNYSSAIDRCVGYFTNSCKPQPAKRIKPVRKSRARVR